MLKKLTILMLFYATAVFAQDFNGHCSAKSFVAVGDLNADLSEEKQPVQCTLMNTSHPTNDKTLISFNASTASNVGLFTFAGKYNERLRRLDVDHVYVDGSGTYYEAQPGSSCSDQGTHALTCAVSVHTETEKLIIFLEFR